MPDSVSGHFEGDADDAPGTAQGIVTQDQSQEERRCLSEAFSSPKSEYDRFYSPTDENGEPRSTQSSAGGKHVSRRVQEEGTKHEHFRKGLVGILGREKIAGDGRLSVPVFTQGVFRVYASAAIATRVEVSMSGANDIKIATTADKEKGYVLGRLLEPAVTHTYSEVLLNI